MASTKSIEVEISESVYQDANSQLSGYGETVESKVAKLIKEYALEHRKKAAQEAYDKGIEDLIDKSDL